MKQIYKLIELIKSDKKQEINGFINKENQSLKDELNKLPFTDLYCN
jgi:hypothetical protein